MPHDEGLMYSFRVQLLSLLTFKWGRFNGVVFECRREQSLVTIDIFECPREGLWQANLQWSWILVIQKHISCAMQFLQGSSGKGSSRYHLFQVVQSYQTFGLPVQLCGFCWISIWPYEDVQHWSYRYNQKVLVWQSHDDLQVRYATAQMTTSRELHLKLLLLQGIVPVASWGLKES